MLRILHISDVHIGEEGSLADSYATNIPSDITHNKVGDIDCVVMTGDIYDGRVEYSEDLLNKAVGFFNKLFKKINEYQPEKPLSKNDFIFVPGNHDLDRQAKECERWHKYQDFLEKFYDGDIPKFYNSNDDYSLLKIYDSPEHKVAFVGFNSCKIETTKIFPDEQIKQISKWLDDDALKANGFTRENISKLLTDSRNSSTQKDYDDYGLISTDHLSNMYLKVKDLDDSYTVVALFHHHFTLFPETAQVVGDRSLIRNHTELLKYLNQMNVKVIMHGHKHYDLERPYVIDNKLAEEQIMYIFAGGSACSNRIDNHSFAVLDIYPQNDKKILRHTKFNYRSAKLDPVTVQTVPDENSPTKVAKLIDMLENANATKAKEYDRLTDELYDSYTEVASIIDWVGNAITGFNETYELLESNYKCILYLLFAINLRAVSYMKIMGRNQTYYDDVSDKIKNFAAKEIFDGNFTANKDSFYEIFEQQDIRKIASMADQMLKNKNKHTKRYVSCAILGIFFTDLYLVLTKYPDEFKRTIAAKINITMPKNQFKKHVVKNKISVHSDYDRRCAFVSLYSNDATAHKMAVIFVKEFELIISSIEDYFRTIGLKLYYLKPDVTSSESLEDYNFEAFMPTLIPLLTGEQIYIDSKVFARELIQNSIDAIAVRQALDKSSFKPRIDIILGKEGNRRYFKIIDNGTGMDKFKIERYFTSVGRSFYSGTEYEDLKIDYKPISEFGIGFLSSFMVGREIIVRTKSADSKDGGLKLHIPNYDGCFFLEKDEDKKTIGTEVTIYLEKSKCEQIFDDDIVRFIEEKMCDIEYPINITYSDERGNPTKYLIPQHAIRSDIEENEICFFVPLYPNGDIGNDKSFEENVADSKYGFIMKNGKRGSFASVMNAGVVIEDADPAFLFDIQKVCPAYKKYSGAKAQQEDDVICETIVNFPPNWINLDVSRDEIVGDIYAGNKNSSKVTEEIARSLYRQLTEFINTHEKISTNIPALFLQDIVADIRHYCCPNADLYYEIQAMFYDIEVRATKKGLVYSISRKRKYDDNHLQFYNDCPTKTKKVRAYIDPGMTGKILGHGRSYMSKVRLTKESLINSIDDFVFGNEAMGHEIMKAIENNEKSELVMRIASGLLIWATDDISNLYTCSIFDSPISSVIEHLVLMNFTVGLENEQQIEIKYEDIIATFNTQTIYPIK